MIYFKTLLASILTKQIYSECSQSYDFPSFSRKRFQEPTSDIFCIDKNRLQIFSPWADPCSQKIRVDHIIAVSSQEPTTNQPTAAAICRYVAQAIYFSFNHGGHFDFLFAERKRLFFLLATKTKNCRDWNCDWKLSNKENDVVVNFFTLTRTSGVWARREWKAKSSNPTRNWAYSSVYTLFATIKFVNALVK